jgi:hypothetical protein
MNGNFIIICFQIALIVSLGTASIGLATAQPVTNKDLTGNQTEIGNQSGSEGGSTAGSGSEGGSTAGSGSEGGSTAGSGSEGGSTGGSGSWSGDIFIILVTGGNQYSSSEKVMYFLVIRSETNLLNLGQ